MRVVRTGPLTWGQHLFWFYTHPRRTDVPQSPPRLSRPLVIPDGTRVADLRRAVNACVERFEALRTIYAVPGSSRPQQCVLMSYEAPVLSPDEADDFDPDPLRTPSIRCVVDESHGRISAAMLTVNAVDLDGFAMLRVVEAIAEDLGGGRHSPAVDVDPHFHPIDWATQEVDRYAERSARAVAWMRNLRSGVPRNYLPIILDPAPVRQRTIVRAYVPDLLAGIEQVAAFHSVSAATVVHAGVAVLLAAWADRTDIYLQTVLANRWHPENRGMIGRVAATVACRIDTDPDQSAGHLLRLAHRSLLDAYRYSQHDFGACRMDGVKLDAERGSTLMLPAVVEYFGFLRTDNDTGGDPGYRISSEVYDGGFDQIRFEIEPAWPGVWLQVIVDTGILPPPDAVAATETLADLLRAIVREPGIGVSTLMSAVSLPELKHTAAPMTADGSRHDPHAVRCQLLECSGVEEAAVFIDDNGAAPVRAYLAGPMVDLVDVHERLLLAAAKNPLIRVPTRYRQAGTKPTDPTVEESWLRHVATGLLRPGTDYHPTVDDHEHIQTMVDVFERCHPGAVCEPAHCYARSGGDYLMIPAMLVGLADAGLTGAEPGDFVGIASLAAIARRLRKVAASNSQFG